MNRLIKIITLVLLVSISAVHGMELATENNQILNADFFTPLPNDMLQQIIGYLDKPILGNGRAGEHFCLKLKNIAALNATCRRLNIFTHSDFINLIEEIKSITSLEEEGWDDNKRIPNLFLMYALRYHNFKSLIRLCFEMGADVNYCIFTHSHLAWPFHKTPLSRAIFFDAPLEIIKLLLDNGADANISNGYSATPILQAVCSGRIDLMKLLIEFGANLDQVKSGYNKNSVYYVDHKGEMDLRAENIACLNDLLQLQREKIARLNDLELQVQRENIARLNDFNLQVQKTKNNRRLLLLGGVVVAGGICYWVYNKYKAYKASCEQADQEDNEDNNNQTIEQPVMV